jgi:hypothetical protein
MMWNERAWLNPFQPHDELRDLLTLMITAGADIYAINEDDMTVWDIAHAEGHGEIWAEVLETCGYNADKVSQEDDAGHGWSSAIDSPCTKPPAERPSKLLFAAYLEQREEKRKASCRVREIVDDETAEDDWVREEMRGEIERISRLFGGIDEGDSGSESGNESETYREESSNGEDDNEMLWNWDEGGDPSTEEGSRGVYGYENKRD